VVEVVGDLAGSDHGTGEHGRDVVGGGVVVVLVKGHDEQAVVGAGPVEVGGEVVLGPGVAGGHGTVMHVVAQLGITTATVGRAARSVGSADMP
jgi:hypothetical protein